MTTGDEGNSEAPGMTGAASAGAGSRADAAAQVRRWKIVAMVSAFVAVAAVGVQIGWMLRGAGTLGSSDFTGGGALIAMQCEDEVNGFTVKNAKVAVLDADGEEIASGTLMEPVDNPAGPGCRRAFVIDEIPGGRGIYTIQIIRWKATVTEAALRGNIADMPIAS